jgi:hypothetical protein
VVWSLTVGLLVRKSGPDVVSKSPLLGENVSDN